MDRNNIPLTANLPSFRFNNTSVSKDQAIELEAAGKQPEVDSKRSYLYGPVFAHVLGYIQEFAGQDGLENIMKIYCGGQTEKNCWKWTPPEKLRTISTLKAIPGENLTLSLDFYLQKRLTAFWAIVKGR